MKTFIQNGKTMTIIAPTGGVESGSLVILGDTVGIAANGALEGNKVEIAMEGVFALPKGAGAIGQGVRVFWDATKKQVTTVATNNKEIGVSWETALDAATTLPVKIGGYISRTAA